VHRVQSSNYWSSSASEGFPVFAWSMALDVGSVINGFKDGFNFVWPVRGGQ
jgi:hypothetical protein